MTRDELVAAMGAVVKRHGRDLLDGNARRIAAMHEELADVAEAHKTGEPAPQRAPRSAAV